MAKKKQLGLLIIDGHAMAYRAFFSMQQQSMTHPATGQPTGAIFGFFRMLIKVLFDLDPLKVAITWDPPKGKSFRNDLFKEYKANRKPMPEDLRPQIEEIRNLVNKCGFEELMLKGFEADDLMGTLSERFGKKESVIILSGDKDCYQLLNKNVSMLRPKKGVSEFVDINPAWVKEELGITIKQVTDYMALVGDSADNIPGAKGVGPKSASKLLNEYKTLDKIYKNLDKITAKALNANLTNSKEDVFKSKELVIIKNDLEMINTLESERLIVPDLLKPDTLQLFRKAGLNQIYNDLKKRREKKLAQLDGDTSIVDDSSIFKKDNVNYQLIQTKTQLVDCLKEVSAQLDPKNPVLAIDTETDHPQPMLARLVGISLAATSSKAWYICCLPEDSPFYKEGLSRLVVAELFNKFLQKSKPNIIGQNIKYDIIVLAKIGIQLPAPYFDTMLGSYLCNPHIRRHNMDDMALDLLGYSTITYESIVGSGRKKTTMDQLAPNEVSNYACEDADITLQLYFKLEKEVLKRELTNVNTDIEVALIPVLVAMEQSGVNIDLKYFKKLAKEYEKKITSLNDEIHKIAGREFNIRSTKELQKILFEELQLPHGKKTKTGYSTDQSVLEDLRGQHTIIDHLLSYRKYTKLQSTYVEAIPALLNPQTNRIHTSFHQAIAATGRLSSVEPNLQNIPIREATGRAIRKGFIAASGNELLSLDYSQIELRIMAHFAEDPALIEVFTKSDIDIHARTAARLFETTEDLIDTDQRSLGKSVNFSIIYGVTEFGLSKNLGISRNEARLYIERFFISYPGVRKYMDDTIAFAKENGYVQTLSGRRRQIPDIKSSNRFRREGAERTAINSPIQGSSADIIKLAMIDIHKQMIAKKVKSKMILQVHDELLFDVIPEEKEIILKLAKTSMESAMQLNVPLAVDYMFGKNWDEAH